MAMAGFPIMHLERSLKTLVQRDRCLVALCEEFPRPLSQGLGFERRISRIVTPGTLLDETFLDPSENNYLLAISAGMKDEVGLSWIDVSTGVFFTKTTTVTSLPDELVRLGPREIVLDKALEHETSHPIRATLQGEGHFVSYSKSSEAAEETIVTPVVSDISANLTETLSSDAESQSTALLTSYLRANLLEHMPTLSAPSREGSACMHIDAHTLTALEIRESMRDGGTTGSLLSTIRRTVTSGGTRLLARWLCGSSPYLAQNNPLTKQHDSVSQRVHHRDQLPSGACRILQSTHAPANRPMQPAFRFFRCNSRCSTLSRRAGGRLGLTHTTQDHKRMG